MPSASSTDTTSGMIAARSGTGGEATAIHLTGSRPVHVPELSDGGSTPRSARIASTGPRSGGGRLGNRTVVGETNRVEPVMGRLRTVTTVARTARSGGMEVNMRRSLAAAAVLAAAALAGCSSPAPTSVTVQVGDPRERPGDRTGLPARQRHEPRGHLQRQPGDRSRGRPPGRRGRHHQPRRTHPRPALTGLVLVPRHATLGR